MDLQHCCAPEGIAEMMAEQMNHGGLQETALKHEVNDDGTSELHTTDGEGETNNDRETQPEDISSASVQAEKPVASQMARAQLVLQSKNCSYQADLKTFMVQGTSG